MRCLHCILLGVAIALLTGAACRKKSTPAKPAPPEAPPVAVQDSFDLAVTYNNYLAGQSYLTDTIRFDYKITNFGAEPLSKNSKVLMASKFGTAVFALDLIGQGPTEVTVPNDLPQNASFSKYSGYLLVSSVLAYFSADSLDVTLMVYGPQGAAVSTAFPKDKDPSNNEVVLRLYPGKIKLK